MNTYRKFFNPENPGIMRTRDWKNWPGSRDCNPYLHESKKGKQSQKYSLCYKYVKTDQRVKILSYRVQ